MKNCKKEPRRPSRRRYVVTTQLPLRVKEVPGYALAHPEQHSDKALLVDWEGEPFALLYITTSTYTIAWEGVVAFDRLEVEVSDVLKAIDLMDVAVSSIPWNSRTSVAFVFQNSDDSDELEKYHLGTSEDFTRYSKVMQNPLTISFARYDLSENSEANPFFSFIAENAAFQTGFENEVALKLSKRYKLTKDLLEWIIAHHRRSTLLTQAVARESSVSVLNRYL